MSSMIGFDPSKHDIPDDDFPEEEVLPKGEYHAVCIDITEGENRMGDAFVKYRWQIQDGPHQGKIITNFENPSPDNEERHKWYMKRLKSLMTICGISVIERLDQLQMIPLIINNKPYQSSNGGWSNSINYYKRIGAAPQTAPVQATAPVRQAAPPVAQVAPAPVAAPPMQQPQPVPQPVMQATPQVAPQVTPQVAPQVPAGMVQAPPPAPAPQPVPPPPQAQPLPQQVVPLQQAMAQANATYEDADPPF